MNAPSSGHAFSVLFRYRDLVGPTLEQHRAVLKHSAEKKVWWGWWKRPMESQHAEVWDALERALEEAPAHGVPVGLYDSGSDDQVHIAWIDQIKRPQVNQYGEDIPVQLTAEERELVPEYYRDSPFSQAWMRIVHINEKPVPFFGGYSFSHAPDLPNLPPEELAALEGKVILNGGVLRNMEATLWRVRPKQAGDEEERILTFKSAISTAVSRTPIATRGNVILHLSDPHFAVGAHRDKHVWRLESETGPTQTLADALLDAMDSNTRESIGLILVTGDLTFLTDPAEFKEAGFCLSKLVQRLGLGTEHVVVIPGNHDIRWTNTTAYQPDAKVEVAPEPAMRRYRDFYKDFYRHEAHPLLCMGRRYILPPGCVLDVCALNSSSLEHGADFLAGMGRIQESSFQTVINELGWHESPGLALRFLALHHHLVPTEDLETPNEYAKGFGMALDAPRIQRLAAKYGVQLALHGHKHRLFVWRSSVYELPENAQERWYRGELSILGGGSAGSQATEGGKNFFNLIKVRSDELELRTYRSQNRSAFTPQMRWTAAISLEGDKLTLGPWLPAATT